MAEAVLPRLRLHLPGEWWQVPLHDAEAARRSIRSLVERQVGREDARARLRAELRSQFLAALRTAIETDGQSLHLALDVVDGVPLSVSLAVFLPPLGMTPAVGTTGGAVAEVLEAGLRATPGRPVETLARLEAGSSQVVRMHRREALATRGEEGPPVELPALVAEYWITIPRTKRVMLLVFTTVFVELEEAMLGFFDRIVRAIGWAHPEPRLD